MTFQKIKNIFDMYGYTPYLFIGGYKRNGSLLGLLSTLLSIIIGVSISSYFILELFNKKNFTVITSETNPEGIESIKLTKNTFYFSFYLQDPISYKPIIDETIYYPKIYYKIAKRSDKEGFIWTQKSLEYGICELNDFDENYHKFLLNYDLKNIYCIKNLSETIKGVFTKDEYSFIFVEFYECKNTTEKSNCKSKSEINYYLNGSFMAIDYQDITIDPNNFSHPIIPKIGQFYTTLSNNYFKEIHLYFKKILIETDKGLISSNIETKEYVQYNHNEDMISFKSSGNGDFLEFSIKFADKITKYLRTYTKAQTVISNIGGFLKFVQTTFWILSYIFVENTVFQKMINKIFYFEESIIKQAKNKLINMKKTKRRSVFEMNSNIIGTSKKVLNINVKSNSIFNNKGRQSFSSNSYLNSNMNRQSYDQNSMLFYKMMNKDESNYFINRIIGNKNINHYGSYNNKINSFLKSTENSLFIAENKKINLNYCQRFCLKFSKKKKSNIIMLYQKGIGLIEQKLDIISIIKDSFQLSIIKSMFFNNEHILVLDNLIKTELSSENYDKDLTSLSNPQKVNKEVKNAYNLIINRFKSNMNVQNDKSIELNNMDYYFVQLLNEQFSHEK